MQLEEISRITVLGIGVMGPDISLGFALAGHHVTGVDINKSAVEAANRKLEDNLKQMVEGEYITRAQAAETKSRIHFTLSWEPSVASADFITEAVPEIMEIKQEVFQRCDDLCRPGVVLASNTSSMSITEIASGMHHPERAISTHWTIPAHLSPMVEVIRGERTTDSTAGLAFALLQKVGKEPVFCRDNPGFIHNYVQFAMVKAALNLVEAGLATVADVDTVIKNGFGLRLASVGPIEFVDMCGLDTILNIQKYMYQKTKDSVYHPSRLIEELVSHGDLGVKTSKGFYEYKHKDAGGFWEKTNRNIIRVLKSMKTNLARTKSG
jgi:3-hydroxybutyryl-CoA dehydrogenase